MRVFIAFSIILLFSCCKTNEKKDAVISDSPTPILNEEDFTLEIYNFKEFRKFLNQNEGKVHILNFWATWCKPCVEELPYFEQIHERYKDQGVEVILVSLDMPNRIEQQLIPFIKNNTIRSRVIVLDDPGQNQWIPEVDNDWSGAIPATLIYCKGSRFFFEKALTYKEIEHQIKKLLNESKR